MIAVNWLSRCERIRAYVNERSPDGKADLDVLRRLKRYIACGVYGILTEDVSDVTSNEPLDTYRSFFVAGSPAELRPP